MLLHLGGQRSSPAQPVINSIDELRDGLAQPGKVVRLTTGHGTSGHSIPTFFRWTGKWGLTRLRLAPWRLAWEPNDQWRIG